MDISVTLTHDTEFIRKKLGATLQELDKIEERSFDNCPAYVTVHPDNPVYTSENGKLKKKQENDEQLRSH